MCEWVFERDGGQTVVSLCSAAHLFAWDDAVTSAALKRPTIASHVPNSIWRVSDHRTPVCLLISRFRVTTGQLPRFLAPSLPWHAKKRWRFWLVFLDALFANCACCFLENIANYTELQIADGADKHSQSVKKHTKHTKHTKTQQQKHKQNHLRRRRTDGQQLLSRLLVDKALLVVCVRCCFAVFIFQPNHLSLSPKTTQCHHHSRLFLPTTPKACALVNRGMFACVCVCVCVHVSKAICWCAKCPPPSPNKGTHSHKILLFLLPCLA